jgi:hypothetical protein
MQARLRLRFCPFLVAAATLIPASFGTAEAINSGYRVDLPCQLSTLLTEFSDGVTPPALLWLVQHDVGDI